MKFLSDLIEELKQLPQDLPVYHFDGRIKFSPIRAEVAETNLEEGNYRYVMLSGVDEEPDDSVEEDITG
jgi:hypothetical protein